MPALYPNTLAASEFAFTSYQDAQTVTPSDTLLLPAGVCRGFIVGGAGTIKITTPTGSQTTITIPATACGFAIPVQATQVWATGTVATLIVALY